jgi:hypothetical protein
MDIRKNTPFYVGIYTQGWAQLLDHGQELKIRAEKVVHRFEFLCVPASSPAWAKGRLDMPPIGDALGRWLDR